MTRTALILGSSGRFGRHISDALSRHGWTLRKFDRAHDTLPDAAMGASLIVNAWNPPYSQWATLVPDLTRQVIGAAKASGAAVMIPGNIYVYGEDLPPVLSPDTPHRSAHPLGQIRRTMESAYRDAGVKTVILRAGDYIDTEQGGNWFDRIIAARIGQGKVSYPGPLNAPHAWAFLPDVAEAGARLADQMDTLPPFSDFTFDGFTLTGAEMTQALERATGRPVRAKQMSWLPIQIARPFWREAKHLLEMRYLWRRPHGVDGSALQARIKGYRPTPLEDALRRAVTPLI
ncbi:epimerase [Jannaschia sp. CCS1]|uniref:epimerase n=1 Tax=Jannaschia sp. (strain CCS1) TaxID=290400 RepID=UPI000053D7CB|nr:epimerase [Jannaschia sp. CCS1]ABD53043.1 dTDP-4-dehydrorhamnose reductase [Jannaschia sp. CCS1]